VGRETGNWKCVLLKALGHTGFGPGKPPVHRAYSLERIVTRPRVAISGQTIALVSGTANGAVRDSRLWTFACGSAMKSMNLDVTRAWKIFSC
jgi:hypothetical protein